MGRWTPGGLRTRPAEVGREPPEDASPGVPPFGARASLFGRKSERADARDGRGERGGVSSA
eukprot:10569628-Lingulodinium_polyedra.AAC.1